MRQAPQVTPFLKVRLFAKLIQIKKAIKNLNMFGREVPIQKDLEPDSE